MWKTNCFLLTNIQLQTQQFHSRQWLVRKSSVPDSDWWGRVPFQTVIGEEEFRSRQWLVRKSWKPPPWLCSNDYGPWKHGCFTPDSDYTPILPSTGDDVCTVCPWNLWWGQVMDCEHWDGVYNGLCSYVGVVCMCVCVCVCAGGGGARIVNIIILVESLLMLPLFVFPLCACTHLVRDLFLLLHHLSGTVSLSKLDHLTHSHLSNHLWNFTSSSYPTDTKSVCVSVCVYVCVYVCACVCVCVCARAHKSWFVFTVLVLCLAMGCVAIWRNST